MAVDWLGISYAVLVSAGGVFGYIKAARATQPTAQANVTATGGSVTSLLAGLLFGLLAAVGTYLMSQNPKNVWLSLGTAGTLAVVMGLRFLSSWKFMPAGLMTLTSGLMLAKIFIGMQNTRMHRS
ncbi:transmembrane protein 14C-like isoform 2-T2 [Pholidichthys leucotaenia]